MGIIENSDKTIEIMKLKAENAKLKLELESAKNIIYTNHLPDNVVEGR